MARKGDGEQVLTDCWGEREPGFLSLLSSAREKKSLFAHFSAPFKMFPLRILEQLRSNLEHGWNARLAGGTILEKSEDGSGGNLEQTRQFQPPSNNFLPSLLPLPSSRESLYPSSSRDWVTRRPCQHRLFQHKHP